MFLMFLVLGNEDLEKVRRKREERVILALRAWLLAGKQNGNPYIVINPWLFAKPDSRVWLFKVDGKRVITFKCNAILNYEIKL